MKSRHARWCRKAAPAGGTARAVATLSRATACATLARAVLTRATLARAVLTRATLAYATLAYAVLAYAVLAGVVATIGVTAGATTAAAQAVDAPLPVAPLPESPLPAAAPHDPPARPSVLIVSDSTIDDSVRVIVERDFNFSDRIDVVVLDAISRAALVQALDDSLYDESAQYGVAYVVKMTRTATGLRATLYDIPKRHAEHASPFRIRWDSTGMAPRMDLHRFADIVQQWITGARGIAATRIAYVANDQIRLVDCDGADDVALTARGVSLSPAWHPRGTSLVYVDLSDAGTQIARVDLERGSGGVFTATKRGLNITPVFTPSGDSVVYATAGPRGSRLVIASATGTGKARPLAMQFANEFRDVAAPVFSPDGKRLAFVASRPSYPQVYTMDVSGKHVRRLVPPSPKLRNERTAPDWSPDGGAVIYQQQNRKFQVWLAHLHGGVADTVTRMTAQGENEDPSWAPDGEHIVVTSNRSGVKELWIVDLVTGRWRQLTTGDGGARLSSWSPRLAREP